MPEQTFQILGQVIDQTTLKGISGLRVEAWDLDTNNHDPLGQSLTDAEGHFIITFDDTMFSDNGIDALPDMFSRSSRASERSTTPRRSRSMTGFRGLRRW